MIKRRRVNEGHDEIRTLILSALPHVWLVDIDGTLVVHNQYLIEGKDAIIKNSVNFLKSIPPEDRIIFLTSRKEKYREQTEQFLQENAIRYDAILFNLPMGERILINDDKSSGLCTSYAIRLQRNKGIRIKVVVDENL